MIQKKTLALALVVLAATSASSLASAQRPTRIYGSAYVPFKFGWNPFATVYMKDDYGHQWSASTNSLSDWWLDNMPSNRWYTFQAKARNEGWSQTVRFYVPEKPLWQLNKTQIPDLVCNPF